MGGGLLGGLMGGSMNNKSTKEAMLTSGKSMKQNADLASPEKRRSSRLGTDPDNNDMANAEAYIPDPLGLAQTGNLPEIAEAFRRTGGVCVERTLRILSKNKANANLIEDPSQLPRTIESFGRSFHNQRGSKSVAANQSVGYATNMALCSGGTL